MPYSHSSCKDATRSGSKSVRPASECNQEKGGRGKSSEQEGSSVLEDLALVPEWGESSWRREVGWRPEVCPTRAWRPSGLGVQGAAGRAQPGKARKKLL